MKEKRKDSWITWLICEQHRRKAVKLKMGVGNARSANKHRGLRRTCLANNLSIFYSRIALQSWHQLSLQLH